MDPSPILQQAARREAGAMDQLLAATFQEAYAKVGDHVVLTKIYQTMADHLDEVTPRTKFWAWFEQIASATGGAKTASDTPPVGVLESLTASVKVPPGRIGHHTIGERLARLTLSGWMPSYGACAGGLLGILFTDPGGDGESAMMSALGGLALAFIFSPLAPLSLGPWLGGWRRSLSSSRFYPATLIISPFIALYVLLSFMGVFALLGFAMGQQGTASDAAFHFLDEFGSKSPLVVTASAAVGALLAALAGRVALRRHPFVLYKGDSVWRKGLALLAMLPAFWMLAVTAPVMVRGSSIPAEIGTAFGQQIALVQSQNNNAISDRALQFERENSVLAAWVRRDNNGNAIDPKLRQRAQEVWNGLATQQWSKERYWEQTDLLALRYLASQSDLASFYAPDSEPIPVREPLDLEVHLRQALLNNIWAVSSVTRTSELMAVGRAPVASWTRWQSIVMDRANLTSGVAIDDDLVAMMFAYNLTNLTAATDANDHYFLAFAQRDTLNRDWKDYQSKKSKGDIKRPTAPADRVKFHEVDYGERDPLWVERMVTTKELWKTALAQLVIVLELKKLQAEGYPLPTKWDEFRPEIAAIGQTFSDWLSLKSAGDGAVTISMLNLERTEVDIITVTAK